MGKDCIASLLAQMEGLDNVATAKQHINLKRGAGQNHYGMALKRRASATYQTMSVMLWSDMEQLHSFAEPCHRGSALHPSLG